MIRREEALEYHSDNKAGKIEIKTTKSCSSVREMQMAYIPGAAFPAMEIIKNSGEAAKYTSRANLAAVISNGTYIPGLGNAGPFAVKPFLEGISVLFKRLADVDAFDIEINETDPEKTVEIIKSLSPAFGALTLQNIKFPDGIIIYEKVKNILGIPVFNLDLYSEAVAVAAGLLNAVDLANKKISEVKIVLSSDNISGIGIARMLLQIGAVKNNIFVYDKTGLISGKRSGINDFWFEYANDNPEKENIKDAFDGADVYIGNLTGINITPEDILKMNRFPIVFALALPDPEITYEEAKAIRKDILISTSMGEFPNTIQSYLSFPYIIRAALDCGAKIISDEMLTAAIKALAYLAREEKTDTKIQPYSRNNISFGPDYFIPKPDDPRILSCIAEAVANQASIEDLASENFEQTVYREKLKISAGLTQNVIRDIAASIPHQPLRIVFSEGTSDVVLKACRILADEGVAHPIILGSETEIKKIANTLNLDLTGIKTEDPEHSIHYKSFAEEYFKMRQRKGVIKPEAEYRMRKRDYFASMMVHSGEADIMIGGVSTHYTETLRIILEIIGPAPGVRKVSSHHLMVLPKETVFLADCAVNINPDENDIAEIALLTARMVKNLGFEPKAALLSYSNFGSAENRETAKMRKAVEIAKKSDPELIIEGEMQLATARNKFIRQEYFPFINFSSDANVLIFPDLQSANITMQALQFLGNAVSIGPVLMGTRLPAHLIQYKATVEEVVNLATIAVLEASARK